jgi:hydroxyacylglutathione hydrolase
MTRNEVKGLLAVSIRNALKHFADSPYLDQNGPMNEILTIPALTDNYCYLIVDRQSREAVVIDPSEAAPIETALKREGLKLKLILNTHHHHDHVGGNSKLAETHGVSAWCSRYDLNRVPKATRGLSDEESFELLGESWKVLEIPGHTLGQIAFYLEQMGAVFVGDTLFSMGCGRLFEGTPAQMLASLHRLLELPPETRVYFGHEYTQRNSLFAAGVEPENPARKQRTEQVDREVIACGYSSAPTLQEEREINPFLRSGEPQIRRQLGIPDATELEVFTRLREMRNNF